MDRPQGTRGSGRALAILLLALATMIFVAGTPRFSGATYVAGTTNTATVTAARDWTPPTVSLTAPAATVQGVVTLTAVATDAHSGVKNVVVQYLATGGSWVTACTVTTTPYTCDWDTRTLTDGGYSLRAVATDNDGYTSTSATVSTTVANSAVVVLGSPGDVVRGTVAVSATLAGAGAYSVRIEYAVAASGTWQTLCTRTAAPYTCDWVTTSLGNQKYDLRAVATASGTVQVSAVVANVLVDNAAPTITLQDPGSPLRGAVTFTSAAADTHSGLAKVVVQYAASGASTWQSLCSATSNPWSCGYDTTRLDDGTYSFRAVATDVAGNTATSSAITNRAVNNIVSSVSLSDPGQYLGGTVSLNVSASSTAGVVSVRIQRSPTGAGTWTDICTDTGAPYSCSFDTTAVADGSYDLRAVLVDGAGKTTVSAVVTARRVDNTPVRGVDVQAISGGSTSGRVDAGDQMTFLYSEELTLGSVTPGWTGSALAVTLRVRDGNLLGLGNKGDTVDVLLNGTAVNIGSVTLNEDYITTNQTVQFSATLTASGTMVSGVPATLLTLTVGGLPSGNGLKTVATAASMVWTPSAAVTDLAGRAASTAPVTEAGSADREF